MGAWLRFWLTGLLAGLFASAILLAPALQARMLIERATFVVAYGLPDGTLPELCSEHDRQSDGHDRHAATSACSACVIMAAPGLPYPSCLTVASTGPAALAEHVGNDAGPKPQLAWAPQRARAPPSVFIA
jgi:hypothetical protein